MARLRSNPHDFADSVAVDFQAVARDRTHVVWMTIARPHARTRSGRTGTLALGMHKIRPVHFGTMTVDVTAQIPMSFASRALPDAHANSPGLILDRRL